MHRDFWIKQTYDKPAFPDLLWSRPENRAFAGKLLIVGGNAFGFSSAAEAYTLTGKAGIGTARVLLPSALQKSVGKFFEAGEYAPSTPSGSFSQAALAELLAMAHWADATLLAGDIGRNSETAILIEKFLTKYTGQITLTKDAIEYAILQPQLVQQRANTLLVLSFSQLQKLASALKFPTAFTTQMDLLHTVDALHTLTEAHPLSIITKHLDQVFVAHAGQVSSINCAPDDKVWRTKAAAYASVWWLQNPSKAFEALTTSCINSYK